MTGPGPDTERTERLRRRAALNAARLKAHRSRCATCARGSGVYGGLCLLGGVLRRDLEAVARLRAAFSDRC